MNPIDHAMSLVEWKPAEGGEIPRDGLYATHEGILRIGAIEFRCYQLNNGQRVIDADDVERLFLGDLECRAD